MVVVETVEETREKEIGIENETEREKGMGEEEEYREIALQNITIPQVLEMRSPHQNDREVKGRVEEENTVLVAVTEERRTPENDTHTLC